MKNITNTKKRGKIEIKTLYMLFCLLVLLLGCKDNVLIEKPLSFFSSDVVLVNKTGFESAVTALHSAARDEVASSDSYIIYSTQYGTDIVNAWLNNGLSKRDYNVYLTPSSPEASYFWDWAYTKMIPRANIIIDYANRPTASWTNDAEKNVYIAEAKFMRAYAYNVLVNTYGGVPIVDKIATEPKVDFTRASKAEVLAFIKEDLLFASQWLPISVSADGKQDGRIVKAAADHLLSEVYISLGDYDKSIASATAVISDPQYQLMTARFGGYATKPGDVYSDLFKDNNQNRKSGNKETIWAIQIEYLTPGGMSNSSGGNYMLRYWPAQFWNIKDPDGKSGMSVCDSLGRPQGNLAPTNYWKYDIWRTDWNDMRNSSFTIRRTWFYNNPASAYNGKPVVVTQSAISKGYLDTMLTCYTSIRKVEGEAKPTTGNAYGRTFKDYYMMRLAETYLLRAEAYIGKGDLQSATNDVNVVRARAKAKLVTSAEMSIDYILDERARELTTEEPRRRTLIRTGKLLERARKYCPLNPISDKHALFPIPQTFIDANFGATITQNPGY